MNKAMNIGTKVRNAYGETGQIVDRMYSERDKDYYYSVSYDTREEGETFIEDGESIREVVDVDADTYEVESEILNNVCIAKVYRKENGGKKEICRGHGHIIHEGDIGVVQALSYAFKKAYEKINNGNL